MAEQYTPTTELVRDIWLSALWEGIAGEGTEDAQWDEDRRLAQFDRWLAAHDAQVLRDAAGIISKRESTYGNTTCWVYPTIPSAVEALQSQADRIAAGTSHE
jgi:hypothetical protein